MDQPVTTKLPTLDQQIEFVRGARHMVYDEKRQIMIDKSNYEMLMAIEENLCTVKLLEGIDKIEENRKRHPGGWPLSFSAQEEVSRG